MRLLKSVDAHVFVQIAGLSERLLTNVAFMRLLTTMNPHVANQRAGLSE